MKIKKAIQEDREAPMNVLLVVVDTLRADHLGCYGYERATSPRIDGLAEQSVLFEQMIAPAIPTHPSFATLCSLRGNWAVTSGPSVWPALESCSRAATSGAATTGTWQSNALVSASTHWGLDIKMLL